MAGYHIFEQTTADHADVITTGPTTLRWLWFGNEEGANNVRYFMLFDRSSLPVNGDNPVMWFQSVWSPSVPTVYSNPYDFITWPDRWGYVFETGLTWAWSSTPATLTYAPQTCTMACGYTD